MQDRALRIGRRSPRWPHELEEIDAPPEELWVRGDVEWLGVRPRVAIVGTRAPTGYGREQARRFARELAAAGCVIVSGLARGIDEEAHLGALEVGGGTLAVLGCGVDRPWPAGELAERVRERGLLVSEFVPGEPPRRHHFPLRNRVISGLSEAVVVIEAAFASGSLITARWAVDQGRQVFALPGRVDHPMAAGCHRLIRDGAELVERPSDVLAALGRASPGAAGSRDGAAGSRDGAAGSRDGAAGAGGDEPDASARRGLRDPVQREVFDALLGETLDVDELAAHTRRGVHELLPALVELELSGEIVRGPGGLYRRVGG
ncbi:MAG: DNA-processing protein DprA [Planctomycetes bacterium]|nr:DNA-processing protein DprA [Planctomycetota bacterium]